MKRSVIFGLLLFLMTSSAYAFNCAMQGVVGASGAAAGTAPTLFGESSTYIDTYTSAPVSPMVITPPSSMAASDLVVIIAFYRGFANLAISEAGGQTWNSTAIGNSTISMFISWATFDGTWDASPSVSTDANTNGANAVMLVFRPGSTPYTWQVDNTVPESGTAFSAPADPYDVTISGITLATNAVGIFIWASVDDNTWALQTAGFVNAHEAQYRLTPGADMSCSIAYKIGTGASGDVTNRQTANGGDNGLSFKFSVK